MTKIRKKIAAAAAVCCALLLAVAGCAKAPAEEASSSVPETSVSAPASEEAGEPSSDIPEGSSEEAVSSAPAAEVPDLPFYDEDMDHQILISDIGKQTILQMDLDLCEGDYSKLTTDECIVWEWNANEDPNCHYFLNYGLDDAKIRYSAYWERDVVIACSSNGWAGVIDYENKTLLWENAFSNCPHSVELLPNGDLVVAGSGGNNWETDGELVLIPFSQGQTTQSSAIHVPSCHGVQWDPERELLWVLGYYGVIGVEAGEDGSLTQIEGMGAEFGPLDGGGHDFAPVYGELGKYWVTAHHKVWQFDAETMKLESLYDRSLDYSKKDVKGIAYFADGTMVTCVGGVGVKLYESWSTNVLYVTTYPDAGAKASVSAIMFNDREFYKVRAFSKDYQ